MTASKPLSRDETKALLSLIEGSSIICKKSTKAMTNRLKTEEWQRIADSFNSTVSSFPRTPQQLRLKWENLKKLSRRRSTQIQLCFDTIDGGTPECIPPDEIMDRVTSILKSMADRLNAKHRFIAEYVHVDGVNSADGIDGVVGTGDGSEDCSTSNGSRQKFATTDEDWHIKSVDKTEKVYEKKTIAEAKLANGLLEKERIQLERDKVKLEREKLNLENERIKLENEKLKLEIEKLRRDLN